MLTAQFISVGFRSAKPGNVQTFIGTPGNRLRKFIKVAQVQAAGGIIVTVDDGRLAMQLRGF